MTYVVCGIVCRQRDFLQDCQEINIQNFQGVLGNIENSSVTQNLEMRINKNDFESLKKYLSSLGILEQDISELQIAISLDAPPETNEKFGNKVSAWMGKMVSKAALGSWQITVGAAGRLLAKAIGRYYGV